MNRSKKFKIKQQIVLSALLIFLTTSITGLKAVAKMDDDEHSTSTDDVGQAQVLSEKASAYTKGLTESSSNHELGHGVFLNQQASNRLRKAGVGEGKTAKDHDQQIKGHDDAVQTLEGYQEKKGAHRRRFGAQ